MSRRREWLQEARELALHYALAALPTEACSNLGASLGPRLGPRLHPIAAARSRRILALLRPELREGPTLEAAVAQLWRNVGRTFAEYSVLPRLMREGRVGFAEPARIDAAMSGGRSVIFALLHLGNWSAAGEALARRYPGRVAGIALTDTNRAHRIIAARLQKAASVAMLDVHRQVWRTAARHLRTPGAALVLAADEHHEGRVYAPFFGRPPSLDGNLARMVRLATVTGARVMPVYAERRPGARFLVHASPPLEFDVDHRDRAAMLRAVTRLNDEIEPLVLGHLDEWYITLEFDFP